MGDAREWVRQKDAVSTILWTDKDSRQEELAEYLEN